jgi:hypothetical protein
MRNAFIFTLLAFLSLPARAADDPATLKAANIAAVATTPAAVGIFAVQDDGTVRHVQSGLVCPAKYPNASFYQVLVYNHEGTDVGCDYRRADAKGGAWAKLTIFVVKAAEGTTTDQAFAHYESEVTQTYPNAKFLGEAVANDPNDKTSPLAALRNSAYLIMMNGQEYTTQLYVLVIHGWTIEVRVSFVGRPDAIDASREGATSAVLEMGDRVVGFKAMIDALSTVGK